MWLGPVALAPATAHPLTDDLMFDKVCGFA
jgi:hypothetical protein